MKLYASDAVLDLCCIKAVNYLFQRRDDIICSTHTSVHDGEANVSPLKPSLFLPLDFIDNLIGHEFYFEEHLGPHLQLPIATYHRIYCMKNQNKVSNSYALIVIDLTQKVIYLLDPTLDKRVGMSPVTKRFMDQILGRLSRLSAQLDYSFEGWATQIDQHQYFETLSNAPANGTAVYILVMIYFLVMNVPIYLTPESINDSKNNFCY